MAPPLALAGKSAPVAPDTLQRKTQTGRALTRAGRVDRTGNMDKSKRIPRAERRATTQAKVIAAAISCLHRVGYSATGVALVAKEAGVSRGAMSQQFPTKADLMVALVRSVFEEELDHYRRHETRMGPEKWVRALPTLMWKAFSKPSGIAVIEVMLAARSDAELAPRLRIMQGQIEAEAKAGLVEQMRKAGFPVPQNIEVIQHVFVAAVRGLALESMYMKDRKVSEKEVKLLTDLFATLIPPAESSR